MYRLARVETARYYTGGLINAAICSALLGEVRAFFSTQVAISPLLIQQLDRFPARRYRELEILTQWQVLAKDCRRPFVSVVNNCEDAIKP
jgi:hypothetical protein